MPLSQIDRSTEPSGRVVRRRNRVPVSCAPCRARKMKCNRTSPCENCTDREAPNECVYAEPKPRKKRQAPASSSNKTLHQEMQARIDKLEEALRMFMSDRAQGQNSPTSRFSTGVSEPPSIKTIDPDGNLTSNRGSIPATSPMSIKPTESPTGVGTEEITESITRMNVSNINDLHWASALEDIKDARNYFNQYSLDSDSEDEDEEEIYERNVDPLFNVEKVLNEDQLRNSLPPREELDPLIELFFQNWPIYSAITHVPTFRKQYESHFTDPSKTPVLWISMVLSMARRSLMLYSDTGHEPEHWSGRSFDEAERYRELVTQSYLVADYTRPQRYLFEALFLQLFADVTARPPHYYYTIIAAVFRMALRMGLHRDPKWFPAIGTFEGEMRRRVWASLVQAEIWVSGKTEIPSMYNPNVMDTMLPHNLNDEDFGESTIELPPERPLSESTTASTLIVTTRITISYGLVMAHVQKVRDSSYEEVLEIDADIRAARGLVPAHMRPAPQTMKEGHIPMTHFMLCWSYDCFSHRAICLLHRRFLASSRSNPRYAYSRKACIESAIALLDFQEVLHTNWPSSIDLIQYRRFIDDVVGTDFITAATILTLDAVCSHKYSQSGDSASQEKMVLAEEEAIHKLRRSYEIWYDTREVALTSRKSSTILASLLGHLGHYPSKETTPEFSSWPTFAPQHNNYQMAQAGPQSSHPLQSQTYHESAQNAPPDHDSVTPTLYPTPHAYPGVESTTPITIPSAESAQFQVAQQPPFYDPNSEHNEVPLPTPASFENSIANRGIQMDPLNNFISNLQNQNAPCVTSEAEQAFDWDQWDYYVSVNYTNNTNAKPNPMLASHVVPSPVSLASQSQSQYQYQPHAQHHHSLMAKSDAAAYSVPFYTNASGNI